MKQRLNVTEQLQSNATQRKEKQIKEKQRKSKQSKSDVTYLPEAPGAQSKEMRSNGTSNWGRARLVPKRAEANNIVQEIWSAGL